MSGGFPLHFQFRYQLAVALLTGICTARDPAQWQGWHWNGLLSSWDFSCSSLGTVGRPLSLTLSAPLHQLGVPWGAPWALKGMGPGLGFSPGRGPEAGSSAGQQRAGTLALRRSLDHFPALGPGR